MTIDELLDEIEDACQLMLQAGYRGTADLLACAAEMIEELSQDNADLKAMLKEGT